MGDRTSATVIVHACPRERVRAVLAVLDDWALYPESGPEGALLIGLSYEVAEVSCGSADEIASELLAAAPDAVWEVHEDPKYEWLGDLHCYHPLLGGYRASCDADGVAVLTPDRILRALEENDLQRTLGVEWTAAFAELDAVPGPRGILRWPLSEDEQERHDEEEAWREDEAHVLNAARLYATTF